MGGTASLFIWNLAFDPVVAAMRSATGARPPTYVDDLAALVRGPKQAAQIFLLAAGHCAGLLTKGRTCGGVQVNWNRTEIRHALEAFPLDIKGDGDNVTCQGMCPEYLTRILQSIIGQWQRQERDEAGSAGEETGYEPDPGGTPIRRERGLPPWWGSNYRQKGAPYSGPSADARRRRR